MQLMTQVEYARHRGVGKSAVSNWKKAGLLVQAEDAKDGRIKVDVQRTDAKLNGKIDPMRGRPPTGEIETQETETEAPLQPELATASSQSNGRAGFDAERIEELRERRIGNALKNATMAGDLVPLIEAERRVTECGRVARERIHAQFRGLSERIAATSDLRAVMLLCEEAIDAVFAELAAAAARGDLSGDEDDLTPEENAELEAAAVAEGVE